MREAKKQVFVNFEIKTLDKIEAIAAKSGLKASQYIRMKLVQELEKIEDAN